MLGNIDVHVAWRYEIGRVLRRSTVIYRILSSTVYLRCRSFLPRRRIGWSTIWLSYSCPTAALAAPLCTGKLTEKRVLTTTIHNRTFAVEVADFCTDLASLWNEGDLPSLLSVPSKLSELCSLSDTVRYRTHRLHYCHRTPPVRVPRLASRAALRNRSLISSSSLADGAPQIRRGSQLEEQGLRYHIKQCHCRNTVATVLEESVGVRVARRRLQLAHCRLLQAIR